ncbi:TIGR03086 family protein [Nocardia sp. NEAU-G5]|uniref:TIGR03086 family protein n=1 Tax=Nocardia albiluteola TaxID=2842303 RepID=A0ABS6AVH7_9NOCA|nr:TIGR03086 family metal-binding protein [Nocardia albiluteola]MBU3061516.1 TIGR03086 family protein [Nocardia albiluteola]
MTTEPAADLQRAFAAVGELIAAIGPEQWVSPTPCSEWTVRDVVAHLVGLNRVFVAMMGAGPMPDQGQDHLGEDPVAAYRDSAVALTAVFAEPGVLEKTFTSTLGSTTGEIRLRIRIADLLTHGWDLQRATGIRADLPDDLVEQSLAIVQEQMVGQSRAGRFDDPQPVADDAPAIERLAAFTGRKV